MRPEKSTKPKALPFSDEQIRVKAYQIWQKHSESLPEENWKAAIKTLKTEQLSQPFKKFWQWTGFGEKKLWDFLQLLVVPVVLVGTGFYLNEFVKEREHNQQVAEKEREKQSAIDKVQQETLVKYLDQMAELIKTDNLLKAKSDTKTFLIAQVRTVTVLQQLSPDKQRQSAVIQFLRTANLLNPNYSSLAEKKKSKANFQRQGSHGLFYEAQMWTINLRDAILFCADLKKAQLRKANLVGADLGCADLRGTQLIDANLQNALFLKADLLNANLMDANLTDTDFRGANLSDAFLGGANLTGADLRGANLDNAFLGGANLTNADLRGANLSGAILGNANLSGTILCATTFPNGKVRNENCQPPIN
jgi:uncharacterized protein YjbI with pentapeptide repeats